MQKNYFRFSKEMKTHSVSNILFWIKKLTKFNPKWEIKYISDRKSEM